MAPKCEMLMNCSKYFLGICKKENKYDCQTQNNKGNIDVKEQICLTNVNYLKLNTSRTLVFCIYIHMCVPFQKILA